MNSIICNVNVDGSINKNIAYKLCEKISGEVLSLLSIKNIPVMVFFCFQKSENWVYLEANFDDISDNLNPDLFSNPKDHRQQINSACRSVISVLINEDTSNKMFSRLIKGLSCDSKDLYVEVKFEGVIHSVKLPKSMPDVESDDPKKIFIYVDSVSKTLQQGRVRIGSSKSIYDAKFDITTGIKNEFLINNFEKPYALVSCVYTLSSDRIKNGSITIKKCHGFYSESEFLKVVKLEEYEKYLRFWSKDNIYLV